MRIIPAIDLLGGKAVRLYKGDYGEVTTYNDDPVALARSFAEKGIRRLHLVDLDAAKGKGEHNRTVVAKIRKAVDMELDLGGGIRTQKDVDSLLDIGIDRLIIGTAIVKQPEEVARWIALAPGRFTAGVDAYDGVVKIAGWIDSTPLSDSELARQLKPLGFSELVYTNISRDGTLAGADVERTLAMAAASNLPVIVSGGIASTDDALTLEGLEVKGVYGFISGKAFYEGKLDLSRLLAKWPQDSQARITRLEKRI